MLDRRLFQTVRERFEFMPAVVLLGPRQVGKTTLARTIAGELGDQALYLDLERESDRRRLDDADSYLRAQTGRLVILDEVHRAPGLFPLLRGIIDERRAAGDETRQFLLLGSASIELQRQAGESLAGRASYLELTPVGVDEWTTHGPLNTLWLRGGFPSSLLAPSESASAIWREDFVRAFVERDLPLFEPGLSSPMLGRLWRMLAHQQGTPLNKARLAGSLEVSAPTVGRYIDVLEHMLMVRRLQPWSSNIGKRLVRAPKIYLRDSGVLHSLLALTSFDNLLSHPIVGASWEGFVIEQLIAAAGPQSIPMFFRTATGVEADLVFERGGEVDCVIEIKRSTAPTVSSSLRTVIDLLKPKSAYVVHSGDDEWPMSGGITAHSVASLMARLSHH